MASNASTAASCTKIEWLDKAVENCEPAREQFSVKAAGPRPARLRQRAFPAFSRRFLVQRLRASANRVNRIAIAPRSISVAKRNSFCAKNDLPNSFS
jgi:hypothetical protein